MTTKHLISTLAVLLVLASCVCAVSAIQLNVGSVTLPNVGTTGDITLTLDSASNGLSGFSVTFTVADPNIAEIVGVKYPVWTDPVPDFRSGPYVQNSATIKVADVENAIGTSATAIDLGSVSVKGLLAGSTDITVTVNQMDDDTGNAAVPPLTSAKGTISVQQAPGSIKVTSTPVPGADIFIDGSTTSAGKTNTTIPDIPPGLHTVKVSLTGYVDAAQDVTVISGQPVAVNFALKRPVTIIVKTLNVPALNANIYINGELKGTTDTTFAGMPPGTYTVQVTKAGYYSKSTTRTLSPGVSSTFSFTLAVQTNEPPHGSIAIGSTPPGATVIIDGIPQTELQTPAKIEISPGPYDVSVTLQDYAPPVTQHVTVELGKEKTVNFVLERYLPVKAKIVPRTLNLASKGVFVAFITLPSSYNAADVDAKSVVCEGAPALRLVRVKWLPQIFAAIFSREKLVNVKPGEDVKFTVTGTINKNGQPVQFSGSDSIKVMSKKGSPKDEYEDAGTWSDAKILSKG